MKPKREARPLCVPIILIARTMGGREEDRPSLSGYDILIPRFWGRAFLHALVQHGASVVGQVERRQLHLFSQTPCFPWEYPEVTSGPISVVVRSPHFLEPFQPPVAFHGDIFPSSKPRSNQQKGQSHQKRLWVAKSTVAIPPPPQLVYPTLVCVVLRAHGRGVPREGGVIMCPLWSDYQTWARERLARQDGLTTWEREMENWISCKRGESQDTKEEEVPRAELGWVSSGGFSHFEGGGIGLGYCRVDQLYALQVAAVGQPRAIAGLVMYRNPASSCLRVATIHVLTR